MSSNQTKTCSCELKYTDADLNKILASERHVLEELRTKLAKMENRLEQAEESLDNAGYSWCEKEQWYECD